MTLTERYDVKAEALKYLAIEVCGSSSQDTDRYIREDAKSIAASLDTDAKCTRGIAELCVGVGMMQFMVVSFFSFQAFLYRWHEET